MLYSHIIEITGWTFDTVDDIDIPKVEILMKRFNLGIQPAAKKADNTAFMEMLGVRCG